MTTLIDIQHACYSYRQGEALTLEDISLCIARGEYLVLLGHNGSGKSTLARHCNALLVPDAGRVLVDGIDTRDEVKRQRVRDCVGMIFQNPDNQIIATIVEDDVSWSLAVRGMRLPEIQERVAWALNAVGISHLANRPPQKLSGGQRQRLAIAGVLALRPQCIIADEATSMLDPLSRREITNLLHQLRQTYQIAVIQVTHLLEEAILADRVVVMERGRIIQEGTPAMIFRDLDMLRALKLAIPEPLEFAHRLRGLGYPISPEALTLEAIAREVAGV
ncbi:energy-coupling factor transporter ATPase [Ktedonospora formicarum]|uniref:Energy-coupling factor transporter ATP-binding protein EcfA1 n=1 Tax=Ktedonospora formicarum TaxID=2778364 RepID=A0A8J3MPI1_9CHLR|nr:energy-coupling factor transporter ATPase [Ktedonospora formicarum]GHO42940.1 energy-coupling factor transporter ATP-binding protein EcfA1 [Ktedonospora formicarum]